MFTNREFGLVTLKKKSETRYYTGQTETPEFLFTGNTPVGARHLGAILNIF